jgi:hypothetical protein
VQIFVIVGSLVTSAITALFGAHQPARLAVVSTRWQSLSP